ncbi:hypothetical protein [Microbacterium sp. LMI1x-1-1.1]|uniref:hypothetical protein n=1 Tax=Microbacterium sp. LMI1x-1-1.1 TaxID=3135246 RepID=UPI00341A0547
MTDPNRAGGFPHAAYKVSTSTGTRELTGWIRVDEFGYWILNETDLVLHVAHGSLVSIEPATPAVSSTAEAARDTLRTRAGR